MPFYEHHNAWENRGGRRLHTYVAGPRQSLFHKIALNWDGYGKNKRVKYDDLFRTKKHLAWVIPLHILQSLSFIDAATAHTSAGQAWMGILTVILTVPTLLFWCIVCLDFTVRRLDKKFTVVGLKSTQLQQLHACDDSGFWQWLTGELTLEAPYFGRVQPVVDRYLEATAKGATLYDSGGYASGKAVLGPALEKAAKQAHRLLRPIYEEATEIKNRSEQEEAARIASETAFREGEEARITQQRVSMALEDMEAFTAGNQALAQS